MSEHQTESAQGGSQQRMVRRVKPFLWNCPQCNRSHRTNFCPDCGIKKPDEQNRDEKSLSDLRLLLAHCRKVSQGKWNAYQTALREGMRGDSELLSYEKHKRLAEAAEWAVAMLS